MFLKRLVELSERPDYALPPSDYGPVRIRYLIELDASGRLLKPSLTDTSDPARKETRRGQSYNAPTRRRTSAVVPLLLVDNATYILGIAKSDAPKDVERAPLCQQAFAALVADCAAATGDASVAAVSAFLANGELAALETGEGFDPTANLSFSVEGEFPFQRRAVQRYWATRNEARENVMQCVVCGQRRPTLKRLKWVIKGIPGPHFAGTSIISANENAYESYGLEASLVSATCADCAERSHMTLNALLRDDRHRVIVGKTVLVFWAREETPFSFVDLLTQPSTEEVRRLALSPYAGRPMPADANRFYAAMLGASGSRVQVRSWLDVTVDEAQHNLARWFARQRIVGPWGEEPTTLGVRSLAAATVRTLDDVTADTLKSLYLAALSGRPVPASLLWPVVARTRADQTVQHNHAAMLKLVLCGQHPELEDTMAQLDPTNTQPAYLCGRLLAELEQAQRSASPGVKASIVDRYYGTACTAPATVFGTLLQNAQAHLAKLERDRRGAYVGIQTTLEEILGGLDGFPATLTLNEQSLFALGYYHQRAHNRARAIAHTQEAQS